MGGEHRENNSIIELAAIIILQCKLMPLELRLNMSIKLNNDRQCFKLVLQRKSPYIMCVVIEVKLITINTCDRGNPNI